MRQLASIQKIVYVEPIHDASAIELVHVLGWQCVIKKGEFAPGQFAVYCEIDSFLPIRPEFEFLRKTSYKKNDVMGEGFRLKTIRLRGVLSQGLLLPLTLLPEGFEAVEGADVTDLLGIKKYEEPESVGKNPQLQTIPAFISKTDEVRIQSEPALLQEFAGKPYYITTKLDGTSCTLGIDSDGSVHACGHNFEFVQDDSCSFWKYARQFVEPMQAYRQKMGYATLYFQGEFCGQGIQKNRLKLVKPEWFVFTMSACGKRRDLFKLLSAKDEIGFSIVPIEERGNDLLKKYPTLGALLARAEGEYSKGGQKEGIVIRPEATYLSPILYGRPLSIKVINNKFLLKEKG